MTGPDLLLYRKRLRVKQHELAKRMGVTQGYVSQLEGTATKLPPLYARKAEKALLELAEEGITERKSLISGISG